MFEKMKMSENNKSLCCSSLAYE